MKKLFFLSLLPISIAAMELNPFKDLFPDPLNDEIASYLPSRTCEDTGELKKRAKRLEQEQGSYFLPIRKLNASGEHEIVFKMRLDAKLSYNPITTIKNMASLLSGNYYSYYELVRQEEGKEEIIWRKNLDSRGEKDSATNAELFSFSPDHSKIIIASVLNNMRTHNFTKKIFTGYDRKQQKEILDYDYSIRQDDQNPNITALTISSDGKYAAYLKRDNYINATKPIYFLHLIDIVQQKETKKIPCLQGKTATWVFHSDKDQSTTWDDYARIGFNKQGTQIMVYVPSVPPAKIWPDTDEKFVATEEREEIIELHSIVAEQEHVQKSKKTWKEFCQEKTLYKHGVNKK